MKFNEARDEMLDLVDSLLDCDISWPDTANVIPSSEKAWARVTINHVTGNQASLGSFDSARRWDRSGILIIQLFTPMGDGNSMAYDLAQTLVDGLQLKRGGCVTLRNVALNEVGPDGAFYQMNVTCTFSYDDIR